jgi:ribosomal protein S6
MVVYGYITNEFVQQYVRLTSSAPFFEQESNQDVEDADVRLHSSEGKDYRFEYRGHGYYVSIQRFSGKPGVTYNLDINVDFDRDGEVENYGATTTMPATVEADSVEIVEIDIMGYRHYSLNLYMQDPPEANYYLFKFFINDTLTNDFLRELIISDDHTYNGSYIDGASIIYFEDAENEEVQEMNEEYENMYLVTHGDRVRFQVINIEKGYYDFIRECKAERRGENPFFGGPPSNITTNITNNGIGYFSSYYVQEKEVVVP